MQVIARVKSGNFSILTGISLDSSEDAGDWLAVGNNGERASELVVKLEVGGDAEAAVDGCDDLGGGDRVRLRAGADLVAGAVDVAGLDSAAGEEERVAEIPVVAAGGGVDLGASAELAHDDDQGAVEHAAGDQVVEQARDGRVELRKEGVFERGEVVAVRIPGGIGVGRPGDAGDADAGLDQAAG